jgi:sugar phosphate permease
MQRFLVIFSLVFAGEAMFSLPFHVPRFFRPTLLDVFDFSNTQLGDIFAAYGLVAMLAYFPGGAIADRFSPRVLLTTSLLATAAGGLLMARIPGAGVMTVLYGYWGLTTIFLFWAAMIRATREWGGTLSQGKAFGILDGGRGLVAAVSASAAVIFLSWLLPADISLVTEAERETGLRMVIYLYTGITAFAALLTWSCLPRSNPATATPGPSPLTGMGEVLRRPQAWAISGVVVCAYCTYKALDNYALYAVEVLGMNELEAADFTSKAAYLRIVGAVVAGIIADRFSPGRTILVCFTVLCLSYLFLSGSQPGQDALYLIIANLLVTFLFVYALRGLYFALLQETDTPGHLTGTTVGMVSVLGFASDLFFYPLAGRILDFSPGVAGHQNYFALLVGIAVLGLLVTLVLVRLIGTQRTGN